MFTNLDKLNKKTKLKGITKYISTQLYYKNPYSVLSKGYKRTINCQSLIKVDEDGYISSSYCGKRWCLICNKIKVKELLDKYLPTISTQKNMYMVVLSKPNIKLNQLSGEVEYLINCFRKITKGITKNIIDKSLLFGLRKLEITYNPITKDYHPHFHILINSYKSGKYILDEWLKLNPDSKRKCGNDIIKLDSSEDDNRKYIEIFKYCTKIFWKNKKGKMDLDSEILDNIFTSLSGKRIYQRFGKLELLKLEDMEKEDRIKLEEVKSGLYKYIENEHVMGYYNIDDDTPLVEVEKSILLEELNK